LQYFWFVDSLNRVQFGGVAVRSRFSQTQKQVMTDAEVEARMEPWFREEIDELRRQGATDDDIREPAFAKMLSDRVMQRHSDEIDEPLINALARKGIETATSDQLREVAERYRKGGNNDLAYDFEHFADVREREDL
jgi:hypothetical protein